MHYLVQKFLEQEENQIQFNMYLSNPTNENKVAIQERFNDFCLKVKLLSYCSKSLPFFSQNANDSRYYLRKSKTGSSEPEKKRKKKGKILIKEQDFIMKDNNVLAEKSEKKSEKMQDLCTTLL